MIKLFNSHSILDMLLYLSFGEEITVELSELLVNPIDPPISYQFNWNFNNFWDDYGEIVNMQSKMTYNSITPKEQEIYKNFLSKINELGENLPKYEAEHKKISQALGIITNHENLDMSQMTIDKSPLALSKFRELLYFEKRTHKFIENFGKKNIILFLTVNLFYFIFFYQILVKR